MYISNITNDYGNITDHDNITWTNFTNSENNFETIIALFTKIPCGMSLICLIFLMTYTLIKPLFNNK